MISAIYDGSTLLSVSYCNRMFRTLEDEYTRKYSDITVGTFLRDEKIQRLAENISYYRKMAETLEMELEKVGDDELVSFITKQMAIKIKKACYIGKVSISFSRVSHDTVSIHIDKVFNTELTFKRDIYEEWYEPNEHYDGYHDTAEEILCARSTDFLRKIISTMTEELQSQFKNRPFSISIYN